MRIGGECEAKGLLMYSCSAPHTTAGSECTQVQPDIGAEEAAVTHLPLEELGRDRGHAPLPQLAHQGAKGQGQLAAQRQLRRQGRRGGG